MDRFRRFVFSTSLLAAFLVPAGPAAAQGAGEPPAAQAPPLGDDAPPEAVRRYRMGKVAYRRSLFEDAAREFRVAQELLPFNAKIAFNLARALERAHDAAGAIREYERYLTLAPEAEDRVAVSATLRALWKMSKPLFGEVVVTSEPPGADVFVDVATSSIGVTPMRLRLLPGAHVIRLQLTAHEPQTLRVDVKSGASDAVTATLASTIQLAPADPARAALAAPRASEVDDSSRWATWTALGAGGVGLLAGAAFWLQGRSTADEAATLGPDDSYRHARLADELSTQNLMTAVSLTTGVALSGLGAWLFWSDDAAPATTSTRR